MRSRRPAAGRVAGTLVDGEDAERHVAAGVRCLIVAWPRWVAAGASAFPGRVRSLPNVSS